MSRQTTMSDQDADNRQMLAGASLVAASGLLFALAGVAIRLASAGLSSVEVLFWRNVLSLLILTPWIIVRWPDSIRPAHTGLIVMRGVAVVVSLLCYYYAVSVIPLGGGGVAQLQRPDFRPGSRVPAIPVRTEPRRADSGGDGFRGHSAHPQAGHGTLRTRRLGWTRGGRTRRTRRGRGVAHAETGERRPASPSISRSSASPSPPVRYWSSHACHRRKPGLRWRYLASALRWPTFSSPAAASSRRPTA